jgi:hypothetical protein
METKLIVERYWPEEIPEGDGWLVLNWNNLHHQRFGHHTEEARGIYERWIRDLEAGEEDYYCRWDEGDLYGRLVLVEEEIIPAPAPVVEKDPNGYFDDEIPF